MNKSISSTAADARERSRQTTGQFGTQEHADPGVVEVPDQNPNLTAIRDALAKDPQLAINVVANLIVNYGAATDWNDDVQDHTTDILSAVAKRVGLPRMGDQDRAGLKFYRLANGDEVEECACQQGASCGHEGPCEADPEEDDWGWDGMCLKCCRYAEAAEAAKVPHCSCSGGYRCDHTGDCGDYPVPGGNGMCASCAALNEEKADACIECGRRAGASHSSRCPNAESHCDECGLHTDDGHMPGCSADASASMIGA